PLASGEQSAGRERVAVAKEKKNDESAVTFHRLPFVAKLFKNNANLFRLKKKFAFSGHEIEHEARYDNGRQARFGQCPSQRPESRPRGTVSDGSSTRSRDSPRRRAPVRTSRAARSTLKRRLHRARTPRRTIKIGPGKRKSWKRRGTGPPPGGPVPAFRRRRRCGRRRRMLLAALLPL
ncbi:unnamed protein product, partial [Ixodes persulcatus]